jgi:hypothetical protein
MPRYETVCDCCLEMQHHWTDELESRDCPICGVGRLLGPWPVKPRFETGATIHVSFPHFKEPVAPEPDWPIP